MNNRYGRPNKKLSKNARRKIQDYKLSRYACHLIIFNCDHRKKVKGIYNLNKTTVNSGVKNLERFNIYNCSDGCQIKKR